MGAAFHLRVHVVAAGKYGPVNRSLEPRMLIAQLAEPSIRAKASRTRIAGNRSPPREDRGYRRRRPRRSINSKTAPASNAKPLVAVAGSISGTDDTTAEAVPANPTTIIATLLPSKISLVVMIAFILFTPLKQSQLICVEVRTAHSKG
jgi:hypothetical protein